MGWVNRWIARAGRRRRPHTVKNPGEAAPPRATRKGHHNPRATGGERTRYAARLDETEALGPAQPAEVPLLPGARVEGIEVVATHDPVPGGGERVAHVRADEPGRA